MPSDAQLKTYLGDAVYADFDGFGIVLTTENGVHATNTIVLEPAVYHGLVAYVAVLAIVEPTLRTPPRDNATPEELRALAHRLLGEADPSRLTEVLNVLRYINGKKTEE